MMKLLLKGVQFCLVLILILSFSPSDASSGSMQPMILSYAIHSETVREVTAYNVGDPAQNSGDACISANGENICSALDKGYQRCAANFVPMGTVLHIEKVGYCTVTDRMNRRYRNRVDIAMKVQEKEKAKKFGRQKLQVRILKRP